MDPFDHPFFKTGIRTFDFMPGTPGRRAESRGATPDDPGPSSSNTDDLPPNVEQGTGPMGPTFVQSNMAYHAPNLRGIQNFIKANQVMVGDHLNMDINVNNYACEDPDSSSDQSSDGISDDDDNFQEKFKKEREEQERIDRNALFYDTMESTRPISDKEMLALSEVLLGAWKKFLRYLDMEDDDIDRLYREHGNQGLQEVVYRCLLLWSQTEESPEVGKVANALSRVGMWEEISQHLEP